MVSTSLRHAGVALLDRLLVGGLDRAPLADCPAGDRRLDRHRTDVAYDHVEGRAAPRGRIDAAIVARAASRRAALPRTGAGSCRGSCRTPARCRRHGAADHLQHLGGGRLPLQRLLGLVEQAHVLDRDHGLVGERLDAGRSRPARIGPGFVAQHRRSRRRLRRRAAAARSAPCGSRSVPAAHVCPGTRCRSAVRRPSRASVRRSRNARPPTDVRPDRQRLAVRLGVPGRRSSSWRAAGRRRRARRGSPSAWQRRPADCRRRRRTPAARRSASG